MKITLYELLGLVKDGKAPKKIKYGSTIYEYIETINNYRVGQQILYDEIFMKNYDLNDTVEILEEQKKIPEKLPYYSMEKIQKAKNKDEWQEERISLLEKRVNDLHIKINEIIDYLKSKGEE